MKSLYALLATVGLIFGASAASAIDLTYCQPDGTPYCDGVNINFNGPNLAAFGNSTGCIGDILGGSIVYNLFSAGVGATYGHEGPQYAHIAGEVSFTPPFAWRLLDHSGNILNAGIMCVGAPSTEGGAAGG